MTRAPRSLPPAYFDEKYAADPDPWQFATSDYERGKYAATLGALPRARYARALEVGCSIGVLTAALATHCDALLAVDAAAAPLAQATERCRELSHVSLAQHQVPQDWPAQHFDLILLSEVVYYLDRDDVVRLAHRVAESIAEDGDIVLVHWLGDTDYPLSGDEATELFIASLSTRRGLNVLRRQRMPEYRLDVLRATASAP